MPTRNPACLIVCAGDYIGAETPGPSKWMLGPAEKSGKHGEMKPRASLMQEEFKH